MNLDMNRFGLTRVAAATPVVKPGDPHFNAESIISILSPLSQDSVEIAAFPELSVTGYTCADLFHQQTLLDAAEAALEQIRAFSEDNEMLIIVGAPLRCAGALYNCAVAIRQGEFLGAVPKIHIPNYSEFYEKRWFKSGEGVHATVNIANRELTVSTDFIFTHKGTRVGVEICEDLWVPVPPSCRLTELGADIIVNLSATNEVTGKHSYLLQLIKSQSARCRCGYVYASAGVGESTTDLAFAGNAIIAENGVILAASPRFSLSGCEAIATIDVEALRADRIKYATFSDDTSTEDLDKIIFTADIQNNGEKTAKAGCGENTCEELLRYRNVNPHPFVNSDPAKRKETCDEISSIQAWGLANRLRAIGCMNAVVGISGGLDSTLALLVTVKAFDMLGLDRKGIVGITMPGFGTTGRTHSNANELMERLGVTQMEIPIGPAVEQHFSDIGQNPEIHDITYENSQARERTQILMDMANKVNGLVIGTGDLSELALGWCTYTGDQTSMYGVPASVPREISRGKLCRHHRRSATSPHTPRHRRHPDQSGASPRRQRWRNQAENGRHRRTLRTPRLLPPRSAPPRFPAGKDTRFRVQGIQRDLRLRNDRQMAPHFLPPILRPAIQTLLHARRCKSRQRLPLSPRRLANALRRLFPTLD